MTEEKPVSVSSATTDSMSEEAKRFTKAKTHSIIFAIFVAGIFFWGRDFSEIFEWWPVENDVFGNYGDFIGGVIGTAVTLYSAYLLFITLKEQNTVNKETQKVNANVIKTNNAVIQTNKVMISQSYLQLFDNKFTAFLELYQRALDTYADKNGHNGREAFVCIIDTFSNKTFGNNSTYLNRVKATVKEFEQLYAENCREMSVHLRMLYIVARLIGDTENEDDDGNTMLSEEDRVLYAKCLRGQLCDEEMIMLRYNCLTDKGRNMREFVNKFNLIKHLPLMSLLEFSRWKAKLNNNKTLISCINAHFISLKKFMLECSQGDNRNVSFLDSRKYRIDVFFSDDNKKIKLTVFLKTPTGSPGHEGESVIDKALNCYIPEELKSLYTEFLREMLLVSNFYLFNTKNHYRIISSLSKDKKTIVCTANKKYPWILASWQLDNP